MGEQTHLVIPDKIRFNSENTHLLAIFSEIKIKPSNQSFGFRNIEVNDAKILCLSLNSIFTIIQYMKFRSEGFGDYPRLSREDWSLIYQLNPQKLDSNEKDYLINVFNEVKDYNFPSILDQIKNMDESRLKIDKAVLKIIGFDDVFVEQQLPVIYKSILKEL